MTRSTTIFAGLASLIRGLWVTLKHFFRRPVTERYPHQRPEMKPAFRSAIALIRFDETANHDCVACLQCQHICPSFCIQIEGARPEGLRRKRPTRFDVDYALCSLCGLCIDVCPTETLMYSKGYDAVAYHPDAFVHDLLASFRDQEDAFIAKARAEAEAKAAKKAAAAAALSKKNEQAASK